MGHLPAVLGKKNGTRAFNHQSPSAKGISHIIYQSAYTVTWFINYSRTDSLMLTAIVVKRWRRYGVYDCCRYRGGWKKLIGLRWKASVEREWSKSGFVGFLEFQVELSFWFVVWSEVG